MHTFARLSFLVLLAATALAVAASAAENEDPKIARAKDVFERYVALMEAFAPAVGQLYADDAKVHTVQVSPGGEEQKAETSGRQWKAVVRQLLPSAKRVNDRSTFSDVKARVDGENVRIEAKRHWLRTDFRSDFWMVIGPDATGEWKILEEHSVTRP